MALETIDKKRARAAELLAKKALARASFASAGEQRLAFHRDQSAGLGPGATILFDAPPYVPKSTGFLRVDAQMTVTGTAVDLPVEYQLRVGGAPDGAAQFAQVPCGHVSPTSAASLTGTYACTKGTPITLGIQAATSGGTLTQGFAQLVIQELQTSA